MSTPADRLAGLIVERLLAERLVGSEDAARLTARIAQGKATAEEWRLTVEQVLPQSVTPSHSNDLGVADDLTYPDDLSFPDDE